MVEQRTLDFHSHEALPIDELLLAYINNIPHIGTVDAEDPETFVSEPNEDCYPVTHIHAWIRFKDLNWSKLVK